MTIVERIFKRVTVPADAESVTLNWEGNSPAPDDEVVQVPLVKVDRGPFDTVERHLDHIALGMFANIADVARDEEGGDGILSEDFVGRMSKQFDMAVVLVSEDTPIQSGLAMDGRVHVVDRAIWEGAKETLVPRLPEPFRPMNFLIAVRPSSHFVWPVAQYEKGVSIKCGLGILKTAEVVVGLF